MPKSAENVPTTVCTSCGAVFFCGAAAGRSACWCMDKPALAAAPAAGAGCYCPSCLEQRLSALNPPAARAT
ncbi:MAG: cysteine-rich CWC family protein [Candidatus Accumulibacter sp.]|nr:cysteine-rich CWC family protein [Accumulibacter sp.]